jgi:hypothetical protein
MHTAGDRPRWLENVGNMSDRTLTRLVVTVIVLVGFAVWLNAERDASRGCGADCPTDISASRRNAR